MDLCIVENKIKCKKNISVPPDIVTETSNLVIKAHAGGEKTGEHGILGMYFFFKSFHCSESSHVADLKSVISCKQGNSSHDERKNIRSDMEDDTNDHTLREANFHVQCLIYLHIEQIGPMPWGWTRLDIVTK